MRRRRIAEVSYRIAIYKFSIMKNIGFVFIVLLGCTSSSKEQSEGIDSVSVTTVSDIDTMESTETESSASETVPDEATPDEPYDSVYSTDPIDLDRFAQYPLAYNDYESITGYLKESNIYYTSTNLDGVLLVEFRNSSIRVLIAEAYGDLICSARINCRCFQLGEGVKIGMPLENFLSRTSLTRDSLEGFEPMSYTRTAGGTHVGGTSTVTFYFEEERLISIEYGFDPCMIYD